MPTAVRMRSSERTPSMAGAAATLPPLAETRLAAVAHPDAPPSDPLQLSIVIPTFNERQNVRELIGRVETALAGISWEMIFVDDDSPDGTSAEVESIAARDSRIRCIQRIGRRGLSRACVEGMLAIAGADAGRDGCGSAARRDQDSRDAGGA